MSTVKCQSIINIMEEAAPRKLAESWDNVGLLVGDGSQPVKKVLVSLDIPDWVIDEAIDMKADMIISHHPIIFSGIKKINTDNVLGRKLIKLIRNNISVYCTHTNYDITREGLNDIFCNLLGFKDFKVIEATTEEKLYKLSVYVPFGHEEKLMEAMGNAGAGHIGNYSHCTFKTAGKGTFKPLEGSNPYIGKIGKLENVDEYKLETIATEKILNKIVREMLKAHPYEEVAYYIYQLHNKGNELGIGRLAELEEKITLSELAEKVKKALNVDSVRIAGNPNKLISKAALLNGTGNKFVNAAYFAGAQVLITGDMQYHEIVDAVEMGICIIDAGHFATEKAMIKTVSSYLKEKFVKMKYDVEVIESSANSDPISIV